MENTTRSAALRLNNNNKNLKVGTKEQSFTIIMEVHIALSHAKDSRKIYTEIKRRWYGITQEDVTSALPLCPVCMASQTKITAKQRPLQMILSETIGSRAQMDLIDMTSQQDDGYCWILRLIDHQRVWSSESFEIQDIKRMWDCYYSDSLIVPRLCRSSI